MDKIDFPPNGLVAACVTWIDAAAYSGWHRGKENAHAKPLEIMSVGWLVSQDDKSAVLAMSANRYKIGDLLAIPAQSIVSIDIIPPAPDKDSK